MIVLNKKLDAIPAGAMYCGRPSVLGNPFVIGKDGDRADVIAMYEIWFYLCLYSPIAEFLDALNDAANATALLCWCAPEPCHCDVIARFLEPPSLSGPEPLLSPEDQAALDAIPKDIVERIVKGQYPPTCGPEIRRSSY